MLKPGLLRSLSFGLLLAAWLQPLAQGQMPEYQVKAVFLYNFSQFVHWPDSAFAEEDAPFVIGILGRDPFGSYLRETISGETINNHALVVRHFQTPEEANASQILFIGESDKDRMREILGKLKHEHVLTVSDMEGFGQMGGTIELAREKNKIRLKINQEAAKNKQMDISPKLLRLAEIVSTENSNQR